MAAYLLAVAILFCIQGWPSGTVQGQVRPFLDVYQRSACQARETLVSILQEYPDEISDIFRPSCVAVLRCSGCCTDESLKCTPVGKHTVDMQIMRVNPRTQSSKMEVMKFTEHTACECRPRRKQGEPDGPKEKPRRGGVRAKFPFDQLLTPGAL